MSIFTIPGLAEHRYISLTEYSVLRAYIQNAQLLALCPQYFANDDALSPWTTSNPYPALAPYDICPTPLQLSTPHHPYIDIIGPPSLRDNILLSGLTDEQEEQLCLDLHVDTFTIWGSQPWNALGMYSLLFAATLCLIGDFLAWEISQTFLTNWTWLVDHELLRSSNFWRAERGEGPLVLPYVSGGVLEEIV